MEPLTRFVKDVRTVDPNVTGTPLQNFEASRQIRDSYQTASLYALAMICLVLLVDFLSREHKLLVLGPPLAVVVFAFMMLQTRRIEVSPLLLAGSYILMATAIAAILDFRNLRDAVLAMLPPVAGALMMFGILGLCHLDLNPANLIVLPLILGIGVDDGVHVVHDFRLQSGRYRTSSSTMNAIVLTSLTSMIGFGSMMVAAHRGLSSVGLVLVIGVGSCLFVSLVTLPAILTFISDHGTHAGESDRIQPSATDDDNAKVAGTTARPVPTIQTPRRLIDRVSKRVRKLRRWRQFDVTEPRGFDFLRQRSLFMGDGTVRDDRRWCGDRVLRPPIVQSLLRVPPAIKFLRRLRKRRPIQHRPLRECGLTWRKRSRQIRSLRRGQTASRAIIRLGTARPSSSRLNQHQHRSRTARLGERE